ncbi:histidine phosphatase family protein [Ferrimicrobium acidiphilum]|uniref:histidine phosphatase family protein n=1 Tax=Ferrimicrobium acidiphilum TaxID=121039 RepID=UPI0023F5745F|nr:histidine phosphatase family protein [Ferrimicrobium acidiphilum]
MTNIGFLRHGETEWNREHRFLSFTDIRLSAEGTNNLKQSLREVSSFRPFTVITSPLTRCLQSAEIAFEDLGASEILVWDDLVEVNFGSFEGMTHEELTSGPLASQFSAWLNPDSESAGAPMGESWADVERRAETVLSRLSGFRSDVLVVGHGYLIRVLLVKALVGLSPKFLRTLEIANSSLSIISNKRGYWRLEVHNTSSHFLNWNGIRVQ